ncbi:hypothetical protein MSG28_001259 [Choristoneura fumiferana]|uniref:Uncharacterized protein n=1 Tax=Choristoneura fumiferana TaxID=7141 RepID=A0ACC0K4N2_CHOFU|nr:hypothetical protein MSG28_001259 [Choristoneura fumiferana]
MALLQDHMDHMHTHVAAHAEGGEGEGGAAKSTALRLRASNRLSFVIPYLPPLRHNVCLGFVENLDENGVPQKISNEYVLGGHYEIDIAGIRYAAKVHLHSPNLPTKYPDKERDVYQATRKHAETQQFLGRHYQP